MWIQYFNTSGMTWHRKKLRNNATKHEKILWEYLKWSQFYGLKFRRQHSVWGYVIDFYCNSYKIWVELDGNHHLIDDVKEYDAERTKYVESAGVSIIRFFNKEIDDDIEQVLERLKNFVFCR